jgi:hypothetical protein
MNAGRNFEIIKQARKNLRAPDKELTGDCLRDRSAQI